MIVINGKRFGIGSAVVIGVAGMLVGFGSVVTPSMDRQASVSTHVSPQPSPQPPAYTKLSNTEKAGRLVCMSVNSLNLAVQIASQLHVGCFLLTPGGDVYSKAATDAIKTAAGMKVILAIDEEGGSVTRLDMADFSDDSALAMGSLTDTNVRSIGSQMGRSITAIGVNLDFAPVLDINDASNQAIGYYGRAFSSDPSVISEKAGAFASGLRDMGVIPTYKHFPGLGRATGSTGGNTDTGTATSPGLSELKTSGLIPYKNLLPSQPKALTAVMVGNQIVPELTDGQPASQSADAYRLLRTTYKFNGVVFTDSLSAESLTVAGPQAVVTALEAGADLPLLTIGSFDAATSVTNAVSAALNNGSYTQDDANRSLGRIESLRNDLSN